MGDSKSLDLWIGALNEEQVRGISNFDGVSHIDFSGNYIQITKESTSPWDPDLANKEIQNLGDATTGQISILLKVLEGEDSYLAIFGKRGHNTGDKLPAPFEEIRQAILCIVLHINGKTHKVGRFHWEKWQSFVGLGVLNVLRLMSLIPKLRGPDNGEFRGNEGQIRVAERLGGVNVGGLGTASGHLDLGTGLEWTMMKVPYEFVVWFKKEILDDDGQIRQEYSGSDGQLIAAQVLGGANLGNLHTLASGLGVAKKAGWKKMNVPYEKAMEFKREILGADGKIKPEYRDNSGQLAASLKLGKIYLVHLYGLASGLGVAAEAGWTVMNIMYDKVEKFRDEILDPSGKIKEEFKTNKGQLCAVAKLGISHLSQIYTLASSLGVAAEAGWTQLTVPLKTVFKFSENILDELGRVKDEFKGIEGELEAIRRLDKMNPTHFYVLARWLDVAQSVGWVDLRLPYKTIRKFKREILNNDGQIKQEYLGNDGQLIAAQVLGGANLENLYALANTLGVAKGARWSDLEVPYETAKAFKLKILNDHGKIQQKYHGNPGRVLAAGELGSVNIASLHALARGLKVTVEAGWSNIS